MQRSARRLLAATSTLAALCASGCLPSRDNPNDPLNAPTAVARIIGIASEAGVPCPAPDPSSWPEVLAGSRGLCLALDATSSSDPTDPVSALDFTLSFEEPCDGGPALLSTASVALIPNSRLPACAPDEPVSFVVRVEDPDGGRSFATARFDLENARPIARANAPRALPAGGFVWAPGAPFKLSFSARGSVDPDGDPLLYEFTFGDGTVVQSSDADSPLFVESVPVTSGATSATLRVYDGDPALPSTLRSAPTTAVVRVRESNVWANSPNTSTVYQLDGVLHPLMPPLDRTTLSCRLPPGPGGDVRLAVAHSSSGQQIAITSLLTGAVLPLADRLGELSGILADEGNDELWIVNDQVLTLPGCPVTAGDFTIRRYDTTTLQMTGCQINALPTLGQDTFPIFSIDGAHRLWRGNFFFGAATFAVFDASGPAGTPVSEEERTLTALAARPGTDEMWALWIPDIFSASTAGSSVLNRFTSPTAAPERFELPNTYAFGLKWVDKDRFWIFQPSRGMLLVEADLLTDEDSFDDAVLLEVPDVIDGFSTLVEPDSGTVWASDFDTSTIYRSTITGEADVFLADGYGLQVVDQTGAIWFRAPNGYSYRGLAPDSTPFVTSRAAFTFDNGIAFDPATGGVWASVPLSGLIQQIAEDDTLGRSFSTLSYTHGGFLTSLAVAPHGTSLYAIEVAVGETGLGVMRFGLEDEPPTGSVILGATVAQQIQDHGGNLSAAPPFGSQPPRLWMVAGTTLPEVMVAATNGTGLVTRFAVPGSEWTNAFGDQIAGVAAWNSDRYCLAVKDDADGLVHLRSIPGTGVAGAAYSFGFGLFTLEAVAASPSMCWALVTAAGQAMLVGIDEGGTLQRSHTVTADTASFLPVDSDDLWLTVFNFGGGFVPDSSEVVRLSWNGVSFDEERRDFPVGIDLVNGTVLRPLN